METAVWIPIGLQFMIGDTNAFQACTVQNISQRRKPVDSICSLYVLVKVLRVRVALVDITPPISPVTQVKVHPFSIGPFIADHLPGVRKSSFARVDVICTRSGILKAGTQQNIELVGNCLT